MTETAKTRETRRIITWRTLVFGLGGIFIMSGLAPYHDNFLGGTIMIGNHMPGGVFTYMIFLGLFWNGFWKILDRILKTKGALTEAMALSTRELVIVMAVTLVACFPPTSGLGRYFHRMVMLPWYYLQQKPTWIEHGLLTNFMRPELFPNPWPGAEGVELTQEYDLIYRGFFTGLASGTKPLSLAKLWDMGVISAWARPLALWGSLLALLSTAIVSLQYLVHRQWSKHEQLSYPVAQVAASFCKVSGEKKGVPDIFRNPLFWWGFIPVFSVLMVIYLSAWYPQEVPNLQQMLPSFKSWWLPISDQIPILKKVPNNWSLNSQSLYFTIVGLAYFVSAEISLTMGFSMFLQIIFCVLFYLATGLQVDSGWMDSSRTGAYLGYTAILVYTGRNYYKSVFGKALGLNRSPRSAEVSAEEEALSIMAARVLLLTFAAFVCVLSWLCQSWLIALFYGLLTMVMYLVLSRVVCETGIPYIQANWSPGTSLLKLIGPAAIGPKPLTFMLHSSGILTQDPRECLMPYVATGAKVAEDNGVNLRRLYWIVIAAVALALVVAWLSCTYTFYNYNAMTEGWSATYPPQTYLDSVAQSFQTMKMTGVFNDSLAASPLKRLTLAQSSAWDLRYFFAGLGAVMALSALRFRFSKFPIHPVIFLVAGTYPCNGSWASFLLGWFVKTLVTRFGGGGVYQRLKPLFIGFIAAELFMIGLLVFIDFLYHNLYGTSPVSVSIMPG